MRRILYFCLVSLILSASSLPAQNAVSDSLSAESSTGLEKRGEDVRTVSGAVVRSSIFPGWGQWYNGQKFKAALVLGGELGLIGVAVVQNQRARSSKVDDEREFYEDDRSRYLWYAAAFWLLSIIDAHVDAKLREFDISEDLSVGPITSTTTPIGLRMSYRF